MHILYNATTLVCYSHRSSKPGHIPVSYRKVGYALTLWGGCSVDTVMLLVMDPVGHWSLLDTPLLDIHNELEQLSLVEHL